MTMTMIKIGSKVEWNEKKGVVVAFIPAGAIPSEVYPRLKSEPKTLGKLRHGFHGSSRNDRYLVKVPRFHKVSGEPLNHWWYAPTKEMIGTTE